MRRHRPSCPPVITVFMRSYRGAIRPNIAATYFGLSATDGSTAARELTARLYGLANQCRPTIKRGVAAGRSAQRGTSGATTGGGGRSAPDPKRALGRSLNRDVFLVIDGLDRHYVAAPVDPHPTPAPTH